MAIDEVILLRSQEVNAHTSRISRKVEWLQGTAFAILVSKCNPLLKIRTPTLEGALKYLIWGNGFIVESPSLIDPCRHHCLQLALSHKLFDLPLRGWSGLMALFDSKL